MKKTKKLLALFLALACVLSSLSLPALAADASFVTNVEGFKENEAYHFTEDGFYAEASGKGNQFAYSTTTGKDFVYEADVTFNNPGENGAAALLFRSPKEGSSYIANLNGKDGSARVFKFGDRTDGAVDLAPAGSVKVKESNTYHLKVVVIGDHVVYYVDDQLVLNSADYTAVGWNHGQDDTYLEGVLGLMTWETNVTYQNVNYTEITEANSPELSKLSVISNDGEVDKQIVFNEGQYVYIAFVSNDTTSIKLDYAQKAEGTVTATDIEGNTLDLTNLTIKNDVVKGVEQRYMTVTLASEVGGAKVIYRVRVHRGQPDELYYNEDWRGQYHYSVKDGWANDPNGMVYFDGTYHLFYQYFDGDVKWGTMHWAHATSTDLIHWEEQPIEFYPDEYGSMFSGCAVVADHATAPALFAEGETGIVIFITANGANGHDDQKLIIAYSKDGETFQKYKEGQVILHWNELEDDLHNGAFRDPKIFRYEGKWFMVLAGGPLRIYSSDNLIDWKVESTYADLETECPDLYALPVKDANGADTGEVKWVLSRCGRYYKIGDLKQVEGKWRFVPLAQYDGSDAVMNFGHDSYAAMTYYLADAGVANSFTGNQVIEINWMNTWGEGFGNSIPDKTGNKIFNGTFNLQLELGVIKNADGTYVLTQTPIKEYESLRDTKNAVELNGETISAGNDLLAGFSGDSYEILATIKPNTSTEFGFKVRVGEGQETVIKYADGKLVIDRSKSGILVVNQDFMNVVSQTASTNEDGSFTFHIFVDRGSVEVFNGDHTVAGAMQIFPNPASCGLSVYSDDGTATGDITVYPLNTIWTDKVTPEGPIAVNLNRTDAFGYVGDVFTLSGWVSPGTVAQEVVYELLEDNGVVSLKQDGLNAEVKALKVGTATVRVSAKADPKVYTDCKVKVTEDNFQTNLSGFEIRSGTWFVDGEEYIGSHGDNAFLVSDYINSDQFTYKVDVTQFDGTFLNFIFQSGTKDPTQGCYALQLRTDKRLVRLFDFKGDKTFFAEENLLELADTYQIEIQVDGAHIIVRINEKEYINMTIDDPVRQYRAGYVALGLFAVTEARYQNFYVEVEDGSQHENNFQTNLKEFDNVGGSWYADGEDYIVSYPDNGFLYGDYIDSDHFIYEIDTQFDTNCLNLIFQAQDKSPWAGCYALQLHRGENRIRLFDFRDDKTLDDVRDVWPEAEAESYHVVIRVDGLHITASVNGVEYINTTIEDPDRQYHAGYVALGLWNTQARFQNFFVQENPFADVRLDAYYADAVMWAYQNGVTKGTSDDRFSPDQSCTRAQFVTLLWRAAGSPEPTGTESPFTDVSEAGYPDYYKAILWAYENGIASGTGKGAFKPDATVTRAEAVTFMHRCAQKAGIATETGTPDFDDVTNEGVMAYYYDAIGWAVANGITNGNSATANTFGPMNECPRGQVVTFLYRLFAM